MYEHARYGKIDELGFHSQTIETWRVYYRDPLGGGSRQCVMKVATWRE